MLRRHIFGWQPVEIYPQIFDLEHLKSTVYLRLPLHSWIVWVHTLQHFAAGETGTSARGTSQDCSPGSFQTFVAKPNHQLFTMHSTVVRPIKKVLQ